MGKKARIGVGSLNPVKLRAVREVMGKFYEEVEILPIRVETKVQPIGEETIDFAVHRATRALLLTKAELGVGVEAGVFWFRGRAFDLQWCAIVDPPGKVSLGCSPVFQYPRRIEEAVKRGVEVEKAMKELSGVKRIGQSVGAVGYLSSGLTNRLEHTKQAVLMAMLPRLSEELY